MASSDSTGHHDVGWKFHQYSSSGGVLEASSESVLQMNEGSAIEGAPLFGSTSRLKGTLTLDSTTVKRELKQTILDSSSGALLEGFNVLALSSDPAYATLPLNPAIGTKLRVVIQGNSSNLWRITVSSSGNTLNGSTAQYGVSGDSDPNGTLGFSVTFEATGTASYRVHGNGATLAASTALV
jgi:hypothetical protein